MKLMSSPLNYNQPRLQASVASSQPSPLSKIQNAPTSGQRSGGKWTNYIAGLSFLFAGWNYYELMNVQRINTIQQKLINHLEGKLEKCDLQEKPGGTFLLPETEKNSGGIFLRPAPPKK